MGSVQLRVFISHSDDDVEIAKPLITLLRNALNLRSDDIRCSSVDGYRLPAGASTDDILRQEVHDSELLIGLITPSSINSVYVLFELGARWGAGKPMYPLLASGATWEHLEGPLSGINALNCSNASQVIQFAENAAEALGVKIGSASAYVEAVNRLVEASVAWEPAAELGSRQLARDVSGQANAQPTVTHEGPALSEQAQRLLIDASLGRAGQIQMVRSFAGTHVLANTTSFSRSGDRRSVAFWEAVLLELINHALVQDTSGERELFELTHQGFLVANELRASRNSE